MYKIIALIGESGAGKDAVLQELLKMRPDLHEIISYTTRPMREGEEDGVNYFYLTPEEFVDKVANKKMLETTYKKWFYGTGIDSLDKEKINVGVFNPDGVRTLLANEEVDLKVVRIMTKDKIRLIRQLNREKNPDVKEILRRYQADKKDFSNLRFSYNIVANDTDLNKAAKEVLNTLHL